MFEGYNPWKKEHSSDYGNGLLVRKNPNSNLAIETQDASYEAIDIHKRR
jgi:hypothetical protein